MKKMFQVMLGSLLFVCTQTVHSQSFIEPISVSVTAEHKSLSIDSVVSVQEIDFTGNGKPDFLMKTLVPRSAYNEHWLWWVRDDLTVYRKIEIGIGDHEIWKFINLDEDPELEMISAWGYEDGIDYSISDPNYGSDGFLKSSILFNPVARYKGDRYWGYWSNLDSLSFIEEGKLIEVLFEHDIGRDGAVQIPQDYKMPIVFFNCENNPGYEKIADSKGKSEWVTLTELFKRLK